MICSENEPDQIVEINIHNNDQGSFPVLDVFVKVAAHISRGGNLNLIGTNINAIKPIKNITPFISDDKHQLIGNVIYIDRYDNVITNIKKAFFESIQNKRRYEILVRNHRFNKIYSRYSDIVNFDIRYFSHNSFLCIFTCRVRIIKRRRLYQYGLRIRWY